MANIAPVWFGFNSPFLGGKERVLSRQVDERLIKNDLLQLLLTSPGDRVMRPLFGAGLRKAVFDQLDDFSMQELKSNIELAINKWESRVTVTDIQMSQDENILNIKLYGFFNLDTTKQVGVKKEPDLLVELNIPTAQSARSVG